MINLFYAVVYVMKISIISLISYFILIMVLGLAVVNQSQSREEIYKIRDTTCN